ncbi:TonB-dependent receptor family protein [Methylophaga lonarensis]|uniref:TonB-dependent receptor family protein n=1 Tax=Methylophaga lonarensis TaxID=999151 RepID=UPI003D2A10F8
MKLKLISTAVASALMLSPTWVHAEEDVIDTGTMTVTGILPDRLEAVPGSFQIIDSEYLEDRRPISINEALRTVPGVNVVSDGSMSLDVNIGIRGQNPRRSAKTMIMEDGMPLQLAPYVDPVVHYSTPFSAIDRIEVIKGAGQILYGPQTLGGAINYVTRPVPRNGEVEGSVTSAFGNQGYRGLSGRVGWGNEIGGIMIEASQFKGDEIFRGSEFDVRDYRITGELSITDRQTVRLKYNYTDDERNQTENYLTIDEYNRSRFRHPTIENDKWEQERHAVQLQHIFEVNDSFKLSSQAYYTDTFRNGLRSSNTGRIGADDLSWSRLRACPDVTRVDQVDDISICGGRHAPRQFYTWGVETRADFAHNLFGLDNDAIMGVRYHEDRAIRKQVFAINAAQRESYRLALAERPFSHETLKARALSYYAQNTTHIGDWSLTPGFRVERISSSDTQNKRLIGSTPTTQTQGGRGDRGTDNDTQFLPSFGVAWNGIANTTLFAGVHKGISPARANRDSDVQSDTSPEKSTLFEVGVRSNYYTGITMEATLFHNRIKDTIVDYGDFFANAGKSQQTGIELAGRVNFGDIFNAANNFYISGAYTYIPQAKYKSTVLRDGGDELNISGNRMQYSPRNLLNLDFGYEHISGVDARIGVQHVGKQFVDDINTRNELTDGDNPDRRTGVAGIIPSYTIWNATVNYRVPDSGVTLFASVENLFDKRYLASRNEGKLPGRERLFFGGITYDF